MKKVKVPAGLVIGSEVCSVCGKELNILHKGNYLYKIKNPTMYQCSNNCWKIQKEKLGRKIYNANELIVGGKKNDKS